MAKDLVVSERVFNSQHAKANGEPESKRRPQERVKKNEKPIDK